MSVWRGEKIRKECAEVPPDVSIEPADVEMMMQDGVVEIKGDKRTIESEKGSITADVWTGKEDEKYILSKELYELRVTNKRLKK